MAFQAVLNTADIVITYQQNSRQINNILQAFLPTKYDLGDLKLLADAVDVSVAANWLPVQTLDCSYLRTTVRGLEFENDQEATADANAGVGGSVNTGLPNQVTFSIKKQSGLTGRSARGRVYWIGLTRAQLQTDENKLIIVESDVIESKVDAMRAAISATIWQAVIVSRFKDNVKRPTGVVKNWISSEAVDIRVDTQRPRLG
ncbi:hypothetical protein LCGC14_2706930 [marine sediment metagenome]|uniref:Uncharacterized protein n=1 Tax=marine sediment metagenome TaxID=412755 RepID=A0A0F8ZE14_9ZZZZ